MAISAQQSRLFDFESTAQTSEQQTLWSSPTMEQWHTLLHKVSRRSFDGNRENAMGYWGEGLTLMCLLPVAMVGGFIEYQKPLGKDTRADFFITGLNRYPKGYAIETRVQTGTGSHDNKLVATMVNFRSLGYPAGLLIIGDVIGAKTRRLITELQGDDVRPYDLVGFLTWVQLTRTSQLMAS
jgi:hypothetical protein